LWNCVRGLLRAQVVGHGSGLVRHDKRLSDGMKVLDIHRINSVYPRIRSKGLIYVDFPLRSIGDLR
jgi:hypothetical protein